MVDQEINLKVNKKLKKKEIMDRNRKLFGESLENDKMIYLDSISDICRNNSPLIKSSFKNFTFKLFSILFGVVIAYYGFFELYFPQLAEQLNFSISALILISSLTFTIVGLIIYISYKERKFNTMRWIVYFFIYGVISASGIVGLISSMIEVNSYEIIVSFLVSLCFSIVTVILSFFITRKIVCKVKYDFEELN